jgi:hypothetical protein
VIAPPRYYVYAVIEPAAAPDEPGTLYAVRNSRQDARAAMKILAQSVERPLRVRRAKLTLFET